MLDGDVSVGAVDDAARRKGPRISAHSLDGLSVLADESDVTQGFAVVKHIIAQARHAARYRYFCDGATVRECAGVYCLNTFAHYYTRKTTALEECAVADCLDISWYCDANKIGAVVERVVSDACHSASNLY